MTASDVATWNDVYSNKQMSAYPDNALIRFVARNYYATQRSGVRFLDLGAGAGASAIYLGKCGFKVTAVDVSDVAISRMMVMARMENLDPSAITSFAVDARTFETLDRFNCVIDISAMCYLSHSEAMQMVAKMHDWLKPGGKVFSITPAKGCDRSLFEAFHTGVIAPARFMTAIDVAGMYGGFSKVVVRPYSYVIEDGTRAGKDAQLWTVEATK